MADMTFLDIQNEILSFRFSEGRRTSCKRWINARYSQIWSSGEWPFKRMNEVSLAVVGGNNTPTMPTDFGKPIALFNDLGNELMFLEQKDFNRSWAAITTTTGRPNSYTVVNRQIILGYTPSSSATYRLDYTRRLTALVSDTDVPLIPAEHRYMLVPGGMASGLKEENDPTYSALEEEFNTLLAAMIDDLLPSDQAETWQFGRDTLGNVGNSSWQG